MSINEQRTFIDFGHISADLNTFSKKKIWTVCPVCGVERVVRFSDYHDNLKCKSCAFRGKGTKPKISKTCKQCGCVFEVHQCRGDTTSFCSVDCYDTWKKHSGANGTHPQHKEKIEIVCAQCGEKFFVSPCHDGRAKFCSHKCRGDWMSAHLFRENSYNWQGGKSFEPYCPRFNEAFKESIREKFGRVCFLCPTTEEENGRKLNVHHVNYNKDCLCDDLECEFVPLCNQCHGKTNGDRKYWETTILGKLGVIT